MKAKIKAPAPKFNCDSCGTLFEIKLTEHLYTNGAGTACRYWTMTCPHCGLTLVPFSGRVKSC